MTAQQLRQAVQAVVQAHHTHNTFYSIWSDAKDRETELTYPCAVWDSWRTWIEEDAAGALNRSVAVRLLIVTAVATDRTPGDRDAAVEAADQAAEDYILKLKELYPDLAITNVATTTQFDEYTQLETGVILSFTATGGPLCLDSDAFGPVCAAGLVVNSDGTFTLSVPSGGTATLPDVTHTDSDGTPVTLPAQTPFAATPCGASGDGYVQLYDDAATPNPIGGLVTVPAGTTVPVTAPHGEVTLRNTSGGVLDSTSVLSGGAADLVARDGSVQARDSDGDLIGLAVPVPSGVFVNVPIPDSVITLPNAVVVNVKATQPYTVPRTDELEWVFAAGDGGSATITVDARYADSYDVFTDDGSSGTVEIRINGGSWAVPSGVVTLALGDTLEARRSVWSAQGWLMFERAVSV